MRHAWLLTAAQQPGKLPTIGFLGASTLAGEPMDRRLASNLVVAKPVGRPVSGIVAYLNAIRQAFLNAGQRLSG